MFPPMYKGHEHVWSTINSECVGCTKCGVVHLCSSPCNIVPCAVEQQDDTSLVCTYTGIVVSSTSFFDPETSICDYNAGYFQMHVDTRAHTHVHKTPSLQHKIEILEAITSSVVHLLFFSKQAHLARETERVRFNRKLTSIFTAHVSRSKNSFAQCNIVSGIEACIFGISSYRRPVDFHDIPPLRHFQRLRRVIVTLLSQIELPRQFIFSEQNEKMKNLIISLMYISSDGISYDGKEYLPKFDGLKSILPLELVLSKCFGIQPKIVTDGENVIKMSITNSTNCESPLHDTDKTQRRAAGLAKPNNHHPSYPAHSNLDKNSACDFANTKVCTCCENVEVDDIYLSPNTRSAILPQKATPSVLLKTRKHR